MHSLWPQWADNEQQQSVSRSGSWQKCWKLPAIIFSWKYWIVFSTCKRKPRRPCATNVCDWFVSRNYVGSSGQKAKGYLHDAMCASSTFQAWMIYSLSLFLRNIYVPSKMFAKRKSDSVKIFEDRAWLPCQVQQRVHANSCLCKKKTRPVIKTWHDINFTKNISFRCNCLVRTFGWMWFHENTAALKSDRGMFKGQGELLYTLICAHWLCGVTIGR